MAFGYGFQYFYGFLGGETDQWTPYLFLDHTQVFPWIGKPRYPTVTTRDPRLNIIAHRRPKLESMLNACLPNPILYSCFEDVDFYVC